MKSLYKMLIMKTKTQLLLGDFNRIVCYVCNFVLSNDVCNIALVSNSQMDKILHNFRFQ